MTRRRLALGGILLAALLVRLVPLLHSPLPYNIDGFVVARTAEDLLATGTWRPDGHDTSRPGAMLLLALASLVTRVGPLALAQPLFSLLGAASAAVAAWAVVRLSGEPRLAPHALAVGAFLGSFVYFSAAVMKQATGFVLLPAAIVLLLAPRRRGEQAAGAIVLLALPLFHHFVAFLALSAVGLALVGLAAAHGWRRVPWRVAGAAAAAAAWSLAWTYALREPIGSSWDILARDAPLYLALYALAAIATYAALRRPLPPLRAGVALAALPALGVAALVANAYVPLFEGHFASPPNVLGGALPYGLVLILAAFGLGRVLATREARLRAPVLGLLMAVVTLLAFALLRGLDAASAYLAQRTVDFALPVVALGYAVAAVALARRSGPARAVVSVLLVALPAATLPIAFADGDAATFGNAVTAGEFEALAWAAAHAEGAVATDTRLGFVYEGYFGRNASWTLAYDLAHGARPDGTIVVAEDWRGLGGESKPLGRYRIDIDALPCETVFANRDARVLRCATSA